MFTDAPVEVFQYVLSQAGSMSRKRVTGFASLFAAAEAAKREVDRSIVWDTFRVEVSRG